MIVYTLEQRREVALRLIFRRCRFWKKNIFSDEAHFHLGQYVNKQNFFIWGTENPLVYIEKPKTSHCMVWIWSRGNVDRYRAMLNEFLFTKFEEEDIGNICFQ